MTDAVKKAVDMGANLPDLIRTRLLGVHPDEQDLQLDDDDWRTILAALEQAGEPVAAMREAAAKVAEGKHGVCGCSDGHTMCKDTGEAEEAMRIADAIRALPIHGMRMLSADADKAMRDAVHMGLEHRYFPDEKPMSEIQRLGQEFDAGEEVVGYLINRPGHKGFLTTVEKALTDAEKAQGWTETPLYAHPPQSRGQAFDAGEGEMHYSGDVMEAVQKLLERGRATLDSEGYLVSHPPQSRVAAEPTGLREAKFDRLTGYPDFIDDPDGLQRLRNAVERNSGHDMATLNHNSLGRLIDTIERLKAALATPSQPDPQSRGQAFDGEGEARADDIRRSIIRQLGDDPHADRIILPGTDWDIVLATLSSAKRGEKG